MIFLSAPAGQRNPPPNIVLRSRLYRDVSVRGMPYAPIADRLAAEQHIVYIRPISIDRPISFRAQGPKYAKRHLRQFTRS